jgi:cystathionine beta-lyase
MTHYNFDEIIDRRHTDCVKYDGYQEIYGADDLLPLWVADMDFRTPDFVLEAMQKRLEHPVMGYFIHSEQYYSSIVNWMQRRHGWTIRPEWIEFAPGIVPGLAFLVQAFTQPGDKVIVQPPVYHPFYYVVEHQHRTIVRSPLLKCADHYEMDFEDLEDKLVAGARMMILCNPHNPVGRCWSREELRRVASLCKQYQCLLVSDEIHSDLIMPGYKHIPTALASPETADNIITCMAPSKTFNIAGLSTSEIIISDRKLRCRFEQVVHDGLHIYVGNIFGEAASIACYTQGDEWLGQLLDYLYENIVYVQDYLRENLPLIKTFRHEATYLMWLDFSHFGLTHEELSECLVKKAKLALNDGAIFGDEGKCHFRLNVACPRATLEEAMHRLSQVFAN